MNSDPFPELDTYTIPSKIVNEERVINVLTPPTYKQATYSLPVGGIIEDFSLSIEAIRIDKRK